ncbi:MAG TPA: 3-hydroxyacyl-CoA dehydrogenase family protein [Chitinophagaceae bacterium]|nr:3-hydroxyacyl-CoA dehydrogenase family protein [Chitinophagaceae bacterium]
MKIVVIGTDDQKKEFLTPEFEQTSNLVWQNKLTYISGTTCYIDLLFDNSIERIQELSSFKTQLIVINAVNVPANDLPEFFIRINGWPGFLGNQLIEASSSTKSSRKETEDIFITLGKKIEWVDNRPGFISARVISMIINEAYLALDENVSSKEDIDTAMKLGTNYPFGPFEWAQKIGLKNIHSLLETLSVFDLKYKPAALLTKEAFQ